MSGMRNFNLVYSREFLIPPRFPDLRGLYKHDREEVRAVERNKGKHDAKLQTVIGYCRVARAEQPTAPRVEEQFRVWLQRLREIEAEQRRKCIAARRKKRQ